MQSIMEIKKLWVWKVFFFFMVKIKKKEVNVMQQKSKNFYPVLVNSKYIVYIFDLRKKYVSYYFYDMKDAFH